MALHTEILTDDRGRPIERPRREDYPECIEGSIAYLNACYAYRDRIADVANGAFANAFGKALKK